MICLVHIKLKRRRRSHEDDRGKVPSGNAHGSGRLGIGICSWGTGTESKIHGDNPPPHDNPWPYNTPQRSSPVLAAVGDISCQPGEEAAGESLKETCTDPKSPYTSTSLYQSQEATANQIEAMKPDAVALLGDLQYQVGRYSDFENSYDLTYGAFKMISRPRPATTSFMMSMARPASPATATSPTSTAS